MLFIPLYFLLKLMHFNFVSPGFIRNQPIGAFHYRFSGKLVSALLYFQSCAFGFTTVCHDHSIFHNEVFFTKGFRISLRSIFWLPSVPMFSLFRLSPIRNGYYALFCLLVAGIDNSGWQSVQFCSGSSTLFYLPAYAGYYFLVQENFNF